MNKIMIFILIAGFVIACGESGTEDKSADTTASTTPNTQAAAADKPDGEKIYKQYCVACHGLYGDMGASGAFNLKESELPVDERVQVITNGRNLMTPFKTLLDEAKIQAVAEYTMTLSNAE